jgi:hypothetical protein
MLTKLFSDKDQDYKAWLEEHPMGYVVNTSAGRSQVYYVLHRATCRALLKEVQRRGDVPGALTGRYIKVCSAERTPLALLAWVRERRSAGFSKLCAVCNPHPPIEDGVPLATSSTFAAEVEQAMALSPEDRAHHLARQPAGTAFHLAMTVVYDRSPYVVAEVLARAQGHCERCGKPAPFLRRTDGSPYLEVHHCRRLADGGPDLPSNALALCPNCHRRAHHGAW